MALRLYNSLTRNLDAFEPMRKGKVGLYTCGPTVYDYAHIGNFRAYIFEDLLRRTLARLGYEVTQVMNLTDVDDKTIRNSIQAGTPLAEYTEKYKRAFFADLETLRIQPAEHYPAATEHIDDMIALVARLVEKGHGYVADDGCVYFSISSFPKYGQLVNINPEQLRSSGRVRNDEYAKDSVADFALWKAHTPEDGDVAWDSPWGRGRPGWHIECSAMSMRYLGPTFDIHTGGVDNAFPHHEDEIAQSEAANDCRFVRYWLHCAHLIVDGTKMSKSLGNFHTLRDLTDKGYTGRQIRWVLLGTHYRQQLNFTLQGCDDAQTVLRRLDEVTRRLKEAENDAGEVSDAIRDRLHGYEQEFSDGLEDDLNISAALAALFGLVKFANRALDRNELTGEGASCVLNALRRFDAVLGVIDVDEAAGEQSDIPASVTASVRERQEARKAKDFARADDIRDSLAEQGWIVEDTPDGPRIKRILRP